MNLGIQWILWVEQYKMYIGLFEPQILQFNAIITNNTGKDIYTKCFAQTSGGENTVKML